MADEAPTTVDTAGVTRTETGEIAPPQVTRRESSTSTETTSTEAPKTTEAPKEGETLLSSKTEPKKEETPAPKAPETYADFTVPEGYTLDAEVAKEAGAIFKELNLPQEAAQKLVDFYVAKTSASQDNVYKVYNDMRQGWRDEVNNDAVLSHKLPQIKNNVATMLNQHLGAKLAGQFEEAMNLTGVGDHPAFVRAFDILSTLLVESKSHVGGNRPSPFGQARQNQPSSAASAVYPHLPSREA